MDIEANADTVATICTLDDQITKSQGHLRQFTSAERLARAFKVFGAWFLAAALSVFVPILHFVLVPSLIQMSLVFGPITWMEKGELTEGELICPNCRQVNRLSKESNNWPKSRRCSDCGLLLSFNLEKLN